MMEILIPILAVTVIGLICAVGLAVASSVMAVKEARTLTAVFTSTTTSGGGVSGGEDALE